MVMATTKMWWYLARASGLTAWAFATLAIVWGVLAGTKLLQGRKRPAWLLDLHRWLGVVTLGFVVVHLFALWMDAYVDFSLTDFLVGWTSRWRPVAVALGVAAMYGLIVVEVTSLQPVRSRLTRQGWRRIHIASYGSFFLIALHAAAAGADARRMTYRSFAVVGISAVLFVLIYRIVAVGRRKPVPRQAEPHPDAI